MKPPKKDEKNPWTTHSTQTVYDNPWIRVAESKITNPSGNPGIYGLVHFKNRAVGIIPIDDEDHTYLVGQYRYATDSYEWEIPEGGCPEGETPEQTAARELREETGLVAKRIEPLITEFSLSNSVSDEKGFVFLGYDLTQESPIPEDTEDLKLHRLPVDEAIEMAMKGEISDSMSVAGLLKLALLR
ncbi:MAG: NUDIX hydrolase [Verrucomicrobiota bacterium]